VRFKLTEPEFYGIWRGLVAGRRMTWILPLVGLVILFAGVLQSEIGLTVAGIVLAAWCPAQLYVLAPRRLWRRLPDLRDTQTLTFTEDGMSEELAESKSTYLWTYWEELSMAGDAYVFRSKKGYTVVPRRAFATRDDEQQFRELTAAHIRSDG
jgi:hypothetical protein